MQPHQPDVKAIGIILLAVVAMVWSVQPGGLAMAHPGNLPEVFQSPLPTPTPPPPASTWLGFDPSTFAIPLIGGSVSTPVRVANVSNLSGADFWLKFDPNVVQVTLLAPGPVFGAPDAIIIANEVDNVNGRVKFAALLPGTAAFSGTGVLANITWKAKSPGAAALRLERHDLSDRNGSAISHSVRDGEIRVSSVSVSGTILLQGRTNHGGIEVLLYEQSCPASVAALATIPGVVRVVTGADGKFQATPEGQTFQCILVVRSGYLTGQKSGASLSGNLGTLTLRGGDVTQDNHINIYDLALIASRMYSSDSLADLNGDGQVNIFDLTIAASNMGLSGPVTNWQP